MPDKFPPHGRNFTDKDIEALSEALRKKMVSQFYTDLGRGVWKFVWIGFLCICLLLASIGAAKH